MNVEDLLIKQNVSYIPKGADFEVSCLNPEHPDRNPSMRIDRITGVFNCFSCEFKGNLFTPVSYTHLTLPTTPYV